LAKHETVYVSEVIKNEADADADDLASEECVEQLEENDDAAANVTESLSDAKESNQ
jgi:hypothetical protein